jgi:hypothetical protein
MEGMIEIAEPVHGSKCCQYHASQKMCVDCKRLRHSLASFLVRIRTDPKTVQTLLRHSDVKLTLQFYTHAVSRDRMVAAGKMLTAILSHTPDNERTDSGLNWKTVQDKIFKVIHVCLGLCSQLLDAD